MKLYYFPGTCALACHIALEWTGAAYQTVRMSPHSTRSPEYLRMNPDGAVPLLEHEGFLLTESVAILGYIAERHPGAALLGDGSAAGRADVMRWLAYLNAELHPAFRPILSPSSFLDDEGQAAVLAEKARTQVGRRLARLDRQLEGRRWLAGMRSVADPYLFVLLRWAEREGIPLHGFANLGMFMERMFSDDAVIAAIASEEGEVTRAGVSTGTAQ